MGVGWGHKSAEKVLGIILIAPYGTVLYEYMRKCVCLCECVFVA